MDDLVDLLMEAAFAGNAWPQRTLKGDEAAYEARQILAARPTADLGEDGELVERGARRLYRDYEETTDEHAELIFTSADPECVSLADEMREWFKAAFEASGAADRLILYREALAEVAALKMSPRQTGDAYLAAYWRAAFETTQGIARAVLSRSGG